ncbi:hypothetical protein [Salegentibacter maritimus]|uniref:hypothetical protein n=1 Tax=Salegentibacter maritimus TaxID=2794347 RepID=UPI0018E41887|nr:hypothetical protein [Salegentibacter maritimus]MBI6115983.1 hypothetical protein [Salegentibacter maritimus]
MQQKDFPCRPLNNLVEEYHLIINSTYADSPERREAVLIYHKILAYVDKHSKKTINLNKLAPQTLLFLRLRGVKLRIKRAGGTKLTRKPMRRKGPYSWDYRDV